MEDHCQVKRPSYGNRKPQETSLLSRWMYFFSKMFACLYFGRFCVVCGGVVYWVPNKQYSVYWVPKKRHLPWNKQSVFWVLLLLRYRIIYVNWVHKKRCVYWGGAAGERSETADCPPSINTPFFMCAIQVFIRYLSFPADNEKPCYNVTRNSKNSEHFRLKFKKIGAGMMTSIFLNLL